MSLEIRVRRAQYLTSLVELKAPREIRWVVEIKRERSPEEDSHEVESPARPVGWPPGQTPGTVSTNLGTPFIRQWLKPEESSHVMYSFRGYWLQIASFDSFEAANAELKDYLRKKS